VRRALAIQQIINREWGLAKSENPEQGSFIVEELTALVEEAVLCEFERITERGGVLGAMEKGYQRSSIQDESLHYEKLKHSGDLPIIGVNTFLGENRNPAAAVQQIALARATDDEKQSQLQRLRNFHERNGELAPSALARLQEAAVAGRNVFEEMMSTVRVCSLGQITKALYQVGGQYRRSM
jgi:isobutyryl-CoA mutase